MEELQVSITEGKNNNFQELTEVTNVIDEFQQNRKMIAEIKETIPTKTSEAHRNKTPRVFYSRKEKDYNGIRILGVPESKAQTSREKYEEDFEVKIFQHLKVEASVDAVARLGKPQGDKTRGIVVKIPNEHYRKLIILTVGKQKTYEKSVYKSRELSPKDQAK